MRKLLILLSIISLGACKKGNIESTIPTNKVPTVNVEPSALLDAVRKEPKVKEAIITDAKVLYVSVDPDGTNRDGYAQYLCELVKENKGDVEKVKVVQFGTSNSKDADNAFGKLLGESICN